MKTIALILCALLLVAAFAGSVAASGKDHVYSENHNYYGDGGFDPDVPEQARDRPTCRGPVC